MKLTSRAACVVASSLCAISLLVVSRCCHDDGVDVPPPAVMPVGSDEHRQGAAAVCDAETRRLRRQVAEVTAQLAAVRALLANCTGGGGGGGGDGDGGDAGTPTERLTQRPPARPAAPRPAAVAAAETLGLNNEYEVVPYVRFTASRVYSLDPGLGRRVVEKPLAHRKRELAGVVRAAADSLNSGRPAGTPPLATADDFIEGLYRTLPAVGTQYVLYFARHGAGGYHQVALSRPFAALRPAAAASRQSSRAETIHLVLPLSDRVDVFAQFLARFVATAVKHDGRVALTVVYFGGGEGLARVRRLVERAARRHRAARLRVLPASGRFSRGRGLQLGALSWPPRSADQLLFLCDVDVVFTPAFLDRCRLNARAGRAVYYPVVFSLYNPAAVARAAARARNAPDPPADPAPAPQLVISKDTGFWRDFGYGMTCQYRSDFSGVGGFADDRTRGWGLEDVNLYRKYVQGGLSVVRAPDPGIFHLWHAKHCPATLSADQYDGCMRSRALNEASHAQLGMLVFDAETTQENQTGAR